MKLSPFSRNATAAAAALALFSQLPTQPARAADTAAATDSPTTPSPTITLDQVVVTATRTAVPLSEAPANVYVTTDAEFSKFNAYRLADVVADIPGLYFRGSPFGDTTPGSGQGGVTLRGISNSRTLVLLDGQPLNSGYSNGVNWSSVSLDDVARIEVVAGAFSSLYGGTAMGGVINVISRVPDHRELITHLGGGGGDVPQWGGGFVYRDVLGHGIAFSFGASYRNNDSYVGDYVVKSPSVGAPPTATPVTGAVATLAPTGGASYLVGDKGKRPWNQWNAFGKVYIDVGSTGKLITGYSFDRYMMGYTPYTSYLSNASGQPVVSGTVTFANPSPVNFSVNESDFLVLQPASESTRRFYANYEQSLPAEAHLNVSVGQEYFTNYYVAPTTGVASYASGQGTLTDSPNSVTDFDAHITIPIVGAQELIGGASLQANALHRKNSDLADWRNPLSAVSTYYDSSGRSQTWGYYAQDRISLAKPLTLYLGARFDDWFVHGRATQTPTASQPNLAASNATFPQRSASQVSPKAALVWRASKEVTFRASAGTAFRTPTLLDLYVPGFTTKTGPTGIRVTEADPNLKPENMRTGEVGTDISLPTGTKFTLTGYDTDLRDLIYQKTIISGTANDLNQTINAGAARILGMESTLRQSLGEGFALTSSFAYTNAKLTRNDAAPATVGRRLTDVPLITSAAGVEWSKGKFSTDAELRYYSHVYPRGDDVNATNTSGVFGSYDAYTVVNAKVAYSLSSTMRLSLACDNLLNRVYYSYYKQPGRSWFVELTSKL